MKVKYIDVSFFVLAAISLLNVNGFVLMTFGISQAGSPFLLLASLVLIFNLGALRQPTVAMLLLLTIVSYIVFSITFSILYDNAGQSGELPVAYANSVLILWAVFSYMGYIVRQGRTPEVLRTVRNLCLAASASVLASPLLYAVYSWVPASSDSRLGGFFGNPDEAGVMACAAVAFILSYPFRRLWVQIVALAATSAAAVLTFSKSAWIVLVLVWGVHFLMRAKHNLLVLLALLTTVSSLLFINVLQMTQWLLHNPYFELTGSQKLRVEELAFGLLVDAGGRDVRTFSGRNVVWKIGWDRIMENPMIGSGMGTFHFLVGGVRENYVWQGVHNVYLMIWGEAGPIPFMLFVVTSLMIAWAVAMRSAYPVARLLGLIIFLSLMVNHNVLVSRYFIVLVGILVTLAASSPVRKGARRPVLSLRLASGRSARGSSRVQQN